MEIILFFGLLLRVAPIHAMCASARFLARHKNTPFPRAGRATLYTAYSVEESEDNDVLSDVPDEAASFRSKYRNQKETEPLV